MLDLSITLVALDTDPAPPLALATLPPIRALNRSLGLSDGQLIAGAGATLRLGTQFIADTESGGEGVNFFAGFGGPAGGFSGVPAHQHWLRSAGTGLRHADLLPAAVAAELNRASADGGGWPRQLGWIAAGLHVDGARYLALVQAAAEAAGVAISTGSFARAERNTESGFVSEIYLTDGSHIEADLFIDASGPAGLLIDQTLGVAWQSWRAQMPTRHVCAARVERAGPPAACTLAVADADGWRSTLPLYDHDVVVRTTAHKEPDPVESSFGEPQYWTIAPGRRTTLFSHNVFAIGEAGTVFDAFEASGLHHVQIGVANLINALPDRDCGIETRHIDRLCCAAADRMADYHALLNQATGAVTVTAELDRKRALFAATGHVSLIDNETYFEPSWAAAFIGLGHRPTYANALAETIPDTDAALALAKAAAAVRQAALQIPPHQDALAQLVAAWRNGTTGKAG